MIQVGGAGLSSRRPRFNPRPFHEEFVMEKWYRKKFFSKYFCFPCLCQYSIVSYSFIYNL
jgi:hypothetical protein